MKSCFNLIVFCYCFCCFVGDVTGVVLIGSEPAKVNPHNVSQISRSSGRTKNDNKDVPSQENGSTNKGLQSQGVDASNDNGFRSQPDDLTNNDGLYSERVRAENNRIQSQRSDVKDDGYGRSQRARGNRNIRETFRSPESSGFQSPRGGIINNDVLPSAFANRIEQQSRSINNGLQSQRRGAKNNGHNSQQSGGNSNGYRAQRSNGNNNGYRAQRSNGNNNGYQAQRSNTNNNGYRAQRSNGNNNGYQAQRSNTNNNGYRAQRSNTNNKRFQSQRPSGANTNAHQSQRSTGYTNQAQSQRRNSNTDRLQAQGHASGNNQRLQAQRQSSFNNGLQAQRQNGNKNNGYPQHAGNSNGYRSQQPQRNNNRFQSQRPHRNSGFQSQQSLGNNNRYQSQRSNANNNNGHQSQQPNANYNAFQQGRSNRNNNGFQLRQPGSSNRGFQVQQSPSGFAPNGRSNRPGTYSAFSSNVQRNQFNNVNSKGFRRKQGPGRGLFSSVTDEPPLLDYFSYHDPRIDWDALFEMEESNSAVLLRLIHLIGFASVNAGTAVSLYQEWKEGEGTYFDSKGEGSCQISTTDPLPPAAQNADFLAALNVEQYLSSAACGMCFRVQGDGKGRGLTPINGDYIVYVQDLCPSCKAGDMDLMAVNGDGRWDIRIKAVQCPVGNTAIQYWFQGSNAWYIKLQVRNTRVPCKEVHVQARTGQWKELNLTRDGHWAGSARLNLGGDVGVRLTSINGAVLNDIIPRLENHVVMEGKLGVQFPLDSSLPDA